MEKWKRKKNLIINKQLEKIAPAKWGCGHRKWNWTVKNMLISPSTKRIEPQKAVLNHQTWEFNYIPNTDIEPWMNHFYFTIKKLACNHVLWGLRRVFTNKKDIWILGQDFRSPTTWPPKWWHFLRPLDFSLSWMVVSLSSIYSIQFENVWNRRTLQGCCWKWSGDVCILLILGCWRTILLKNQTPNGQKANFKMFKSFFGVNSA